MSSASSFNSSFSSRNFRQAKKRLKGDDQDHQFVKRHGNSTRVGAVSNEVMGSSSSTALSSSTNNGFLEIQGTLRPGTIPAYFPTQMGISQINN